jgi:YHS domain-containing protein
MKLLSVVLLALTLFTHTNAQSQQLNLSKGVALEGYDPVAYQTDNKAVKGNASIAVKHEQATYYFASNSNKSLFLNNPGKYLPAYGGWCAYAMGATGEKVEVDPETFKVINGSLHLFYHSWTNNTLTKWNKDEKNLKAKADQNWLVIKQKKN